MFESSRDVGVLRTSISHEPDASSWWCVRAVRSEKFIVVIAKLAVVLTGIVGSLLLLSNIEGSDVGTQKYFFFWKLQSTSRNDFPLQKAMIIAVSIAFFAQWRRPASEEKSDIDVRSHIVIGAIQAVQLIIFTMSLGFLPVELVQMLSQTSVIALLFYKWKRLELSLSTIEIIAGVLSIIAVAAAVYIEGFVSSSTSTTGEEIKLLGDPSLIACLIVLASGIIGSTRLFIEPVRQHRECFYGDMFKNYCWTALFTGILALLVERPGFELLVRMNWKSFLPLALAVSFECFGRLKKIHGFVFMKYFQNIFEPIIAWKFQHLFGESKRHPWSYLFVCLLFNLPANIILMREHAKDIKESRRHRDSTFVDVLQFYEYEEMTEIHPENSHDNGGGQNQNTNNNH